MNIVLTIFDRFDNYSITYFRLVLLFFGFGIYRVYGRNIEIDFYWSFWKWSKLYIRGIR